MLQLPVDMVKHQQLAPAVLQQLHLVAHLKHTRSHAADTHRARAQPWRQPVLRLHQLVPSWPEGAGLPWCLQHPSGHPALRLRVSSTLQPRGSDSSNSQHQPLRHFGTLALDLGRTHTHLRLTQSTTEREFPADWHQCQKNPPHFPSPSAQKWSSRASHRCCHMKQRADDASCHQDEQHLGMYKPPPPPKPPW